MFINDFNPFLAVPAVIMLALFASRFVIKAVEVLPYRIEYEVFSNFVSVFGNNSVDPVLPNEHKKLNSRLITFALIALSLLNYFFFFTDFKLFFAVSFFTYILFALAMIDLSSKYLPDQLTYILLWGGVLASLFNIIDTTIQESVLGVISGYSLVYICARKLNIAKGDFKLTAAIGAWLGLALIPYVFIASLLLVLITVSILTKTGVMVKGEAFAFGQYLALSGWLITIYTFLN